MTDEPTRGTDLIAAEHARQASTTKTKDYEHATAAELAAAAAAYAMRATEQLEHDERPDAYDDGNIPLSEVIYPFLDTSAWQPSAHPLRNLAKAGAYAAAAIDASTEGYPETADSILERLQAQARTLDHMANNATEPTVQTILSSAHFTATAIGAIRMHPETFQAMAEEVMRANRDLIAWALGRNAATLPPKGFQHEPDPRT